VYAACAADHCSIYELYSDFVMKNPFYEVEQVSKWTVGGFETHPQGLGGLKRTPKVEQVSQVVHHRGAKFELLVISGHRAVQPVRCRQCRNGSNITAGVVTHVGRKETCKHGLQEKGVSVALFRCGTCGTRWPSKAPAYSSTACF